MIFAYDDNWYLIFSRLWACHLNRSSFFFFLTWRGFFKLKNPVFLPWVQKIAIGFVECNFFRQILMNFLFFGKFLSAHLCTQAFGHFAICPFFLSLFWAWKNPTLILVNSYQVEATYCSNTIWNFFCKINKLFIFFLF